MKKLAHLTIFIVILLILGIVIDSWILKFLFFIVSAILIITQFKYEKENYSPINDIDKYKENTIEEAKKIKEEAITYKTKIIKE